ncbi:hypothetical protein [Bradyrhizobium canariense]|uniref:hypothetical protein n=1 Tax=Bradyrhizobium canariense TaxID=255045 RepID=UPI001956F73D|nr:hypothetical protein [Bradyrhizobium canariense]MBM7483345.1 hypothetical protein [Bradyrhizobium canariense]
MSQVDKKFFERFPDRRHRIRLAHRAEVEAGAVVSGRNHTWLPREFKHFVAVKSLSPDCRMRLGFIAREGIETDTQEQIAAAFYEAAKSESGRRASLIEAQTVEMLNSRGPQ